MCHRPLFRIVFSNEIIYCCIQILTNNIELIHLNQQLTKNIIALYRLFIN